MDILQDAGWQFVNQLLQVAVPILVTAIVGLAIQQFRLLGERIKQTRPDLHWALTEAAEMAAKAIEQVSKGTEAGGAIKKELAVEAAQKILQERNINIDLDLIAVAIEAAVYEEFNKPKEQ